MAMDNNLTITGNATRDPELRFTQGGEPVANFGVAVNRRWQDRQSNEWQEAVTFVDVTAWGSLAENTADSVGKGDRITVTGRLDQNSWTTQEGEQRTKLEVTAEDVSVSLRWATTETTPNDRPQHTPAGPTQAPQHSGPANTVNPQQPAPTTTQVARQPPSPRRQAPIGQATSPAATNRAQRL